MRVWLDGVAKRELSAAIVIVGEGLARVSLGRGEGRNRSKDGDIDAAGFELAGEAEEMVGWLVGLIAGFEDQSYRPFISCRGDWRIECDAGIDHGNS